MSDEEKWEVVNTKQKKQQKTQKKKEDKEAQKKRCLMFVIALILQIQGIAREAGSRTP